MNPAWLCNGELLINPSMTLEGSLFSYPQVKYLRLVSRVPKKCLIANCPKKLQIKL